MDNFLFQRYDRFHRGVIRILQLKIFLQETFQFITCQMKFEVTSICNIYCACLFAHDDGYRVTLLSYTQGSTMTQSQILWYIKAVRHRQNTSRCDNTVLTYNHSPIMKRTIFEKYVFYKLSILFS